MLRATLDVCLGNLLLSISNRSVRVCTLRTDVASGELIAVRAGELDTHVSNYEQIRAAGLALVRFADMVGEAAVKCSPST